MIFHLRTGSLPFFHFHIKKFFRSYRRWHVAGDGKKRWLPRRNFEEIFDDIVPDPDFSIWESQITLPHLFFPTFDFFCRFFIAFRRGGKWVNVPNSDSAVEFSKIISNNFARIADVTRRASSFQRQAFFSRRFCIQFCNCFSSFSAGRERSQLWTFGLSFKSKFFEQFRSHSGDMGVASTPTTCAKLYENFSPKFGPTKDHAGYEYFLQISCTQRTSFPLIDYALMGIFFEKLIFSLKFLRATYYVLHYRYG